jgi:8-oxo-dGTP pyrophosphatase MutT (NUDIX family)
MYKVFVNDKPIILSDKPASGFDYDMYLFEKYRIDEVLHKLRHTNLKGVYFFYNDLDYLWQSFRAHFNVVYAAGGLVEQDNTYLLIYRNGRWDLPKGRMETGENEAETALREVEEECGIKDLVIERPIYQSYHIFYEDKKNKLKITDWFLMTSTFKQALTPQKEEGITIAAFKQEKEISSLRQDMYANIDELIQHHFINKKRQKN